MTWKKKNYKNIEITYGCEDIFTAQFHARFEFPSGKSHVTDGLSVEQVLARAEAAIDALFAAEKEASR